MEVIQVEGAKKPIFSWCPLSTLEENARKQMEVIARLPFVEHVALMPDTHLGELNSIGSVIATDGTIILSGIGQDCGCGCGAIKTNLNLNELDGKKEELHHSVVRSIPVGFAHNSEKRQKEIEEKYKQEIDTIFSNFSNFEDKSNIVNRKEFASQLGTLGGG